MSVSPKLEFPISPKWSPVFRSLLYKQIQIGDERCQSLQSWNFPSLQNDLLSWDLSSTNSDRRWQMAFAPKMEFPIPFPIIVSQYLTWQKWDGDESLLYLSWWWQSSLSLQLPWGGVHKIPTHHLHTQSEILVPPFLTLKGWDGDESLLYLSWWWRSYSRHELCTKSSNYICTHNLQSVCRKFLLEKKEIEMSLSLFCLDDNSISLYCHHELCTKSHHIICIVSHFFGEDEIEICLSFSDFV